MKWSKQVGDVVGLCGVMAVAAVSTFNGQFFCTQQWVAERIHAADRLQVVGVTRIQGYQAPVWRKTDGGERSDAGGLVEDTKKG